MATSKREHSHLTFSCGAGVASVNVQNGSLRFEHPDFSMGNGNFKVDISHIYCSDVNSASNMGANWRLNIQQSMFATGSDYMYTDGQGYEHLFVPLDGATNTYYDTTGLNLTYDSATGTISDAAGNALVFNASGKLAESISAQNANIKKIYYYDSTGKLDSVYDNRKSSRKITFGYNSDDLLASIQYKPNGIDAVQTIFYEYNAEGRLTSITRTAGEDIKPVAYFRYDGTSNNLRYAIDGENHSALKFEYNGDKVSKVTSGVCTVSLTHGSLHDAKFVSASAPAYLGEVFVGEAVRAVTGISFDAFTVGDYTKFTYNTSANTVVENNRGIKYDYFFNDAGYTTGVFERRNGDANDLMTLTKDSGVGVASSFTTTGLKINNANSYSINNNAFHSVADSGTENNAKILLNEGMSDKNKNHVLTFWMKLSSASTNTNPKASMLVKYSQTITTAGSPNIDPDSGIDYPPNPPIETEQIRAAKYYSTFYNSNAANSWQFVTMEINPSVLFGAHPVSSSFSYVKGNEYYLHFDDPNIIVSNIRLVPTEPMPKMKVDDKYLSEYTTYSLKKHGNSNFDAEKTIDKDSFFTETDIQRTFYNMLKSNPPTATPTTPPAPIMPFVVVSNNGTRKTANVNSIKLGETELSIDGDGIPNYSVVVEGVNNEGTIEEITSTKVKYNSNNFAQTVTSTMGSDTFTETAMFDYMGNLLEKKDAFDVKTIYTYDSYGNLEKTTVFGTKDGVTTKLEYTNVYNSPLYASDRELLLSATGNKVSSSYVYSGPYENTESVQIGSDYFRKMNYDSYGKLIGINLLNGTTIAADNVFGFDNKGRLQAITNNKYGYSVQYGVFGDICSYYSNYDAGENKPLVSKASSLPDSNGNSSMAETVYNDFNAPSTTVTNIDKHGRVVNINNGDNTTAFTYQSPEHNPYASSDPRCDKRPIINESPSIAKISQIYDAYEDSTYTYHYDPDNNICGYSASGSATTGVKPTEVYRYDDDNYDAPLTKYVYGEDTSNAGQQIVKTKTETKGAQSRIESTKTITGGNKDIYHKYSYDGIGRMDKIQGGEDLYDAVNTSCKIEYENLSGTGEWTNPYISVTIPKVYDYVTSTQRETIFNINKYRYLRGVRFEYEYDDVGRITQEKTITKNCEMDDPLFGDPKDPHNELIHVVAADEKTIDYTYDGMGRIIKEQIGVDKLYEFVYNNIGVENGGGRLSFLSYNSISKREYIYANGNLTTVLSAAGFDKYASQNYTYDGFGNVNSIKLGTGAVQPLTYTRGNLLSSYGNRSYYYNHQGVRYQKKIGEDTTSYWLDGDRILGEMRKIGGVYKNLRYYYNAIGICGMEYDGKTFLFIRDAMGSVRRIVRASEDESDQILYADYNYDAFGACTVTAYNASGAALSGSDDSHIAYVNPFRWKSLYLDDESDLYYANGRYYDPIACQYIDGERPELALARAASPELSLSRNAIETASPSGMAANAHNCLDGYIEDPSRAVGQTPLTFWEKVKRFYWARARLVSGAVIATVGAGVTMIGVTNSISGVHPLVPRKITKFSGVITQVGFSAMSYGGAMVASVFHSGIEADMNAIGWNPFNYYTSGVLSSNHVSFYRGMPVFRNDGKRSGSFLGIWLTHETNTRDDASEVVKHEWGHSVQQGAMGMIKYLLLVGAPSNYEWSNRPYYDRPWERMADVFGGVSRAEHTAKGETKAWWHFIVSTFFGLFGYFFIIGEY